MILTFTANPSIDSTLQLSTALERGEVHRLELNTIEAGGKGINVSHACTLAGVSTKAYFPASKVDIIHQLMRDTKVPYCTYNIDGTIRVNTSITEPDGTTSKFNGLGPTLTDEDQEHISQKLVELAAKSSWVVLAGSLPPGVPVWWYAELVSLLKSAHPHLNIAVDTSDKALIHLGQKLGGSVTPTLLKPNSMELGQLSGVKPQLLMQRGMDGDFSVAVAAARQVIARGCDMVLATLGAAGALIVTDSCAYHAMSKADHVMSTVGAGDCTLAGFIMGHNRGDSLDECLRLGVAYGTAAVGLPGTTIPAPEQVHLADTIVSQID